MLFEYQLDIIKCLFKNNGLEEFRSRNNDSLFIQNFDEHDYQKIMEVHENSGSIVVKTHKTPVPLIIRLIRENNAKVTCCYRDPRDIVLSVLDHGNRSRAGIHKIPSFAKYHHPEKVLQDLKSWLKIYFEWQTTNTAYMIQYEHFIEAKLCVLQEMMKVFRLPVSGEVLLGIIKKHDEKKETKPIFNKGLVYRWKNEMSTEVISLIQSSVGKEIVEMGYDLA